MTPQQRLTLADELESRALLYCEKIIPENYASKDKSHNRIWADTGPESVRIAASLFTVAASLRAMQ
jgi:hypothetical protein